MRAGSALLILSLGTVVVSPAWADVVVLRDGSSVATTKPYVVKGKIAILTRTDGSLVSIPVEEIDEEKTAAAASAVPAPAPVPTPEGPKKATTPAEAAKAKAGRKATVVLTDADVRGGVQAGPSGDKGDKEKGEGAVSISGANATFTSGH